MGPPAAMRIEGGSFGAQIGFSSSDVVLLIMNSGGMKRLTKSRFTIGAEATAAAGPVVVVSRTDAAAAAASANMGWRRRMRSR